MHHQVCRDLPHCPEATWNPWLPQVGKFSIPHIMFNWEPAMRGRFGLTVTRLLLWGGVAMEDWREMAETWWARILWRRIHLHLHLVSRGRDLWTFLPPPSCLPATITRGQWAAQMPNSPKPGPVGSWDAAGIWPQCFFQRGLLTLLINSLFCFSQNTCCCCVVVDFYISWVQIVSVFSKKKKAKKTCWCSRMWNTKEYCTCAVQILSNSQNIHGPFSVI